MAHSLETRVPFLDNDLVDFAMRLPATARLGNLGEVVRLNENEPGDKTRAYFEKTQDGKLLLRQIMQRYVPPSITDAIKQGFSAPDASWFKGESIEYVRRKLMKKDSPLFNFLDRRSIQRLVAEHLEGKVNRRLLIWSLLSIEAWCQCFLIDGPAKVKASPVVYGS
jgi:asparagine synthase (glutamine-hydrolysing)